MPIQIAKENEDGLDPVFEAFHCLRRIFEAAEVLEDEVEASGGTIYVLEALKLPGSEEIVDPNDLNPLNGLERWLAERVGQQVE